MGLQPHQRLGVGVVQIGQRGKRRVPLPESEPVGAWGGVNLSASASVSVSASVSASASVSVSASVSASFASDLRRSFVARRSVLLTRPPFPKRRIFRRRGRGGDPVDATAAAVHPGMFVTFSGVAPIEHVNGTVGAGRQVHPAEPRVGGDQHVLGMSRDVTAPVPPQHFLVRPPAVQVQSQRAAAKRFWPIVPLIDHQSTMRVPAPEVVRGAVARFGPALAGVEVPMVRVEVDQLVGMPVGVERERAGKMGPGDRMPKMPVDGVGEEELADFVPIMSPGVGRPARQRLEPARDRVITPHASFDRHPRPVRRSGRSDAAGARTATATVEPTVGSEPHAVGEVMIVLFGDFETVEHHRRRAVRRDVSVPVGDEQQPRRAHQPDPAMADFDPGQHLDAIGEHPTPVVSAVSVGIL